jgi:predicted O-linked N-acetylglucosamine transferase (SPINDLY family)
MGADWVDYIIADRTIIPPEHLRFYGERVVWDYEAIWRAHEDGRAPAAFAVEA